MATPIDMAERLHDAHATLKRSLLFCVVTGEEKGLPGWKYFAAHPTLPMNKMAPDIDLDQTERLLPIANSDHAGA